MTFDRTAPPPPVLGAPVGVVTRGVADGVGHPPVAGDAVHPLIAVEAEADGLVEASSDGDWLASADGDSDGDWLTSADGDWLASADGDSDGESLGSGEGGSDGDWPGRCEPG